MSHINSLIRSQICQPMSTSRLEPKASWRVCDGSWKRPGRQCQQLCPDTSFPDVCSFRAREAATPPSPSASLPRAPRRPGHLPDVPISFCRHQPPACGCGTSDLTCCSPPNILESPGLLRVGPAGVLPRRHRPLAGWVGSGTGRRQPSLGQSSPRPGPRALRAGVLWRQVVRQHHRLDPL